MGLEVGKNTLNVLDSGSLAVFTHTLLHIEILCDKVAEYTYAYFTNSVLVDMLVGKLSYKILIANYYLSYVCCLIFELIA